MTSQKKGEKTGTNRRERTDWIIKRFGVGLNAAEEN